jgi:hypothetical protein
METLDNLIEAYTSIHSSKPDANKAYVIIDQINKTNKSKDLKKILITYNETDEEMNNILNSVLTWIMHVKINIANDEKWDIWVHVYTQIFRYKCYINPEIALFLFTYKNVERCKQLITIYVRYKYQFNIELSDTILEISQLYPNMQLVINWYQYIIDTIERFDYYNMVCITRNSYELTKLLKSDRPDFMSCEKPCKKTCITYKCMNPGKFPYLYSSEQAIEYKNDKTFQLLSLIRRSWKPSLNKYWPYSFQEFVKTMLLIYNRTLHSLSKDSLFCIIRMLGRNTFSDNVINKISSKENIINNNTYELINSHRLILDFCTVCGKLTKNRCVICRKQGIETRYCGQKCIEYDWTNHKKLHL